MSEREGERKFGVEAQAKREVGERGRKGDGLIEMVAESEMGKRGREDDRLVEKVP